MKIQFDLTKFKEREIVVIDFMWLTIKAQGENIDLPIFDKHSLIESGFVVDIGGSIAITKKGMAYVGFDVRKCDAWIEEYRQIFPTGAKEGKWPFRGSKQGCIGKMNTFLKDNPDVTKEQVLETTRSYVKSFRGNYSHITLAHYFINKNNISMLEGLINSGAEKKDGDDVGWGIHV